MGIVGRDIIVVGSSAGGLPVLASIFSRLPRDLPASIFIVQHVSARSRGWLPVILGRQSSLRVAAARDGDAIEHGRVYVAPPDRHLHVGKGLVHVVDGPKENGHRSAVDLLFRTAAMEYGPRVIGVVLTGARNGGTAGMIEVKRCGGVAVVQDPAEAEFPQMPRSALAHVAIDHCVPVEAIPALLERLAREPAESRRT